MFRRIRNLLAALASRLPAVLVLGALGIVVAAGYVNDWKLPRVLSGPAAGPPQESDPAAPTDTSAAAAPPSTGRPTPMNARCWRRFPTPFVLT